MEQITEAVEMVQPANEGDIALETLKKLEGEGKEEVAVQIAADVDGTPVTIH